MTDKMLARVGDRVGEPEREDVAARNAMLAACIASDDCCEGRSAFLEKRRPQFHGR